MVLTPGQTLHSKCHNFGKALNENFGAHNIQLKEIDSGVWQFHAPMGGSPEIIEHGEHGDGKILNCDTIFLYFQYGDIHKNGEFALSQGRMPVTYAPDSGLVYTSTLDECLCDRVHTVSNYFFDVTAAPLDKQGKTYFTVDLTVANPAVRRDVFDD